MDEQGDWRYGIAADSHAYAMSEAKSVALYPRYCFHLSPTVNTWCLLHATEIHSLHQHPEFEGQKFFFYKNLPIQWVRVVGIVVAIDDYSGRRIYYVDDGSGATIQAMAFTAAPRAEGSLEDKTNHVFTDPKAPRGDAGLFADIDVGAVVDVKGQLATFRDERQINVEKMVLVKTTAQEVVLWEKRNKFHHEVLDVPWVLREKDIRRCRKEAERSHADTKEEKNKQKKKQQQQQKQSQAVAKDQRARRQAVQREARDDSRGESAASGGEGENVRKMIRQDAANGKYSALGL